MLVEVSHKIAGANALKSKMVEIAAQKRIEAGSPISLLQCRKNVAPLA
jgi:hypothetical protein